jgi:hypothetical protein
VPLLEILLTDTSSLVIQVETVRQRHFIQQQVLGGELAASGNPVPDRVVAVEIHVQALHGVGQAADVHDFRLSPVPVGEFLELVQVGGLADGTRTSGSQGVGNIVEAGEVLRHEVGVDAKRDTFIEVFDKLVIQLVSGYECDHADDQQTHSGEYCTAAVHHEVGELVHAGNRAIAHRRHAYGQRQHQRR